MDIYKYHKYLNVNLYLFIFSTTANLRSLIYIYFLVQPLIYNRVN